MRVPGEVDGNAIVARKIRKDGSKSLHSLDKLTTKYSKCVCSCVRVCE